jgi:hypothetical protein
MFKASNHTSVNNAFALNGLKILSKLTAVLGRTASSVKYAADAATLEASMMAEMWSTKNSAYCDGMCTDVAGQTGVTSAAWTLLNDIVPEASIPGVWNTAAKHGAEGFGDYGVFVYLSGARFSD